MIGEVFPTDPLVLLGVAFAAAFLTRLAGVAISGRVEANTPIFHWFACVGQALVGGLPLGKWTHLTLGLSDRGWSAWVNGSPAGGEEEGAAAVQVTASREDRS